MKLRDTKKSKVINLLRKFIIKHHANYDKEFDLQQKYINTSYLVL